MSVDQAYLARLRRLLGISPRGDLDLSHLDSILECPRRVEATLPHNHRFSLSLLVYTHLGLPIARYRRLVVKMCKIDGRLTQESCDFTDGCDTYAQYTLFHCLNQTRLAMKIVPRLPLYIEMQGSLESESLKDNLLLGLPDNNWGFQLIRAGKFFEETRVTSRTRNSQRQLRKEEQTRLVWDSVRRLEHPASLKSQMVIEGSLELPIPEAPEPLALHMGSVGSNVGAALAYNSQPATGLSKTIGSFGRVKKASRVQKLDEPPNKSKWIADRKHKIRQNPEVIDIVPDPWPSIPPWVEDMQELGRRILREREKIKYERKLTKGQIR